MQEELIKFLFESKEYGYASKDESSWIKEKDGSTTISYVSGDWRFHDNYFGGEPYGGRQIVFYKDKPYWMNVYYGSVRKDIQDIKELYSFLKEAMLHPRKHFPLRGQATYRKDDWEYKSKVKGTIELFLLTEKIFLKNKESYSATFVGGLIDQRREN